MWTDSASANSLLSALQQKVEELAQASVVRHVVCLLNCMDAIVFILDGPLGTGQSSRLGGASDGKFSAERERKGFTPSPVLSAGVFSGPGYFISFNNGIPSRARQGSGTSMPPSPRSCWPPSRKCWRASAFRSIQKNLRRGSNSPSIVI